MLYWSIIPPLWLNIVLHKCMYHILLIYLFSLSFSAALNTDQQVFCVKIRLFSFLLGIYSGFTLSSYVESLSLRTWVRGYCIWDTFLNCTCDDHLHPPSVSIDLFLFFPACHKPTSKIILSTSLSCKSASLHQNINSPKTGTLPVLITATFLTPRILITR